MERSTRIANVQASFVALHLDARLRSYPLHVPCLVGLAAEPHLGLREGVAIEIVWRLTDSRASLMSRLDSYAWVVASQNLGTLRTAVVLDQVAVRHTCPMKRK